MSASLLYLFVVLPLTFAIVAAENIANSPSYVDRNNCLLPPHPEHGRYTVRNYPSAKPGERYPSVKLDISCDIGYLNNNTIKTIFCVNGDWSAPIPTCVLDLQGFCTLPTDDRKVEYRCLSFPGTLERSWECESLVSARTLVRPICRFPGFFSLRVLPEMHCKNGMWDYNPICKPACGLTTQHLQLEGTSTNHLELPWHTSIYKKISDDFEIYCGGSLITETKIISTADCFYYYNKELLLSDFVVAVNKMHRSFNDTRDRNHQLSEVTDIKVPSNYHGRATNYVDDIAIVVVKTPFIFHLSVRPVCLNFDNDLDRTQLIEGNTGKTIVWSEAYGQSYVLNANDNTYVKNEDCENMLPTYKRPLLTKDKFCAMYSGEWPGSRDLGSGLAFLESTTQRYYLQGVYSDVLHLDDDTRIMIYTSIMKHEDFIKEHI